MVGNIGWLAFSLAMLGAAPGFAADKADWFPRPPKVRK